MYPVFSDQIAGMSITQTLLTSLYWTLKTGVMVHPSTGKAESELCKTEVSLVFTVSFGPANVA